MKNIYTIRTRDGITFHIQASSYQEAQQRALSPVIGNYLSQMMREAVSHVSSVELHRGSNHLLKYPLIEESFFNN